MTQRAENLLPASPFVGLSPYDRHSARYFAGREREITACYDSLQTSKTTLYYGPTGAGKSSVLGAGIIPAILKDNLQCEHAGQRCVPIFLRDWSGDPMASLCEAIRSGLEQADLFLSFSYPSSWIANTGQHLELPRLALIFDQFEEFFRNHPAARKVTPIELHHIAREYATGGTSIPSEPSLAFLGSLIALVNLPQSRTNFIISLREDCLVVMDPLKDVVPGLFENRLRLDHLHSGGVREVLEIPFARWNEEHKTNYCIAEDCQNEILADNTLVSREWRDERDPEKRRHETFFLQMVLDSMWRKFAGDGITSENYIASGKAEGLRRSFVREALGSCVNQDSLPWALGIFSQLASRMQKFPRSVGELIEELGDHGMHDFEVDAFCSSLVEARIMRTLPSLPDQTGISSNRYEILHDTLAADIHDWRKEQQKLLDELERVEQFKREEHETRIRLEEKKSEEQRLNVALASAEAAKTSAEKSKKKSLKIRAWAFVATSTFTIISLALIAWAINAKHNADVRIKDAELKVILASENVVQATKQADEAILKADKVAIEANVVKQTLEKTQSKLDYAEKEVVEQQNKMQELESIYKKSLKAATVDLQSVEANKDKLLNVAAKLDELSAKNIPISKEVVKEIVTIWEKKETADPLPPTDLNKDFLISRTSPGLNNEIDINQAGFSRDGFYIATAGQDKQLKLWSYTDPAAKLIESKTASSSKGGVLTLTFSSTGLRIITGSAGQSIRAFTHEAGQLLGKEYQYAEKQDDTVMDLECMPESKNLFAASYGNGVTKILSLSPDGISNVDPPVIWSHGSKPAMAMTSVAFSHDGTRAVTSSDDGKVAVWSSRPPYALVTDDLQENPADCNAPTRQMIFSPTDSSLVVGGAGTKVVFWRVGSGQKMRLLDSGNSNIQHEGGVWQVVFHPSGCSFASIATDGKCIIWQVPVDAAAVPQGIELETKIQGRLLSSMWTQNSLILGGEDGRIELWNTPPDAASPILIKSFKVHEGAVWGMTLSPDSKQLLTWSGTDRDSGNLPSPRGAALTYSLLNPIKSDGTAAVWDLDKLLKSR